MKPLARMTKATSATAQEMPACMHYAGDAAVWHGGFPEIEKVARHV